MKLNYKDFNKLTEKELCKLPGVGRTTAKRILGFRPFRNNNDLFKVKGLGNDYQRDTGGNLAEENNLADITRQIRWSLDYAAKTGSWSPWRGTQKKTHGGVIEPTEGLSGAKPIGNWRD